MLAYPASAKYYPTIIFKYLKRKRKLNFVRFGEAIKILNGVKKSFFRQVKIKASHRYSIFLNPTATVGGLGKNRTN